MLNRIIALTFVASAFQFSSTAQVNSPYSSQGFGEVNQIEHHVFGGLGGHNASIAFPNVLNFGNAASYSFLSANFPIFSLGGTSRFMTNSQNGVTEKNNNFGISEVGMGMSFAKRFGFAFGLTPFSSKSYSFSQTTEVMGENIRHEYVGQGAQNKAFLGFSAIIIKSKPLKWSVGGNIGSVFGESQDVRRSILVSGNNASGGVEETSYRVKALHYELSTLFLIRTGQNDQLTIGGTIQPLQKYNTIYSQDLFAALANVYADNSSGKWSLLSETGDIKGNIQMGLGLNVGANYIKTITSTKRNGNKRTSQLMLAVGYKSNNWANYRTSFGDSTSTFANTSGINAGIQFIPEATNTSNASPHLFQRSSYRLGFYTTTIPYSFEGQQMGQWAASFGMGLPLLVDRQLNSSIQFNVGYGQRGTSSSASFNQSFITFSVGVQFAPTFNDRWFVKNKLD